MAVAARAPRGVGGGVEERRGRRDRVRLPVRGKGPRRRRRDGRTNPGRCVRARNRRRARRPWQLRLRYARRGRRLRQGGFRHRRRRRDEVLDPLAWGFGAPVPISATCGRRRLPQLAAGRRPGGAASAAHPQCGWGPASEPRHGGVAGRARRLDLYRKILERQRRNGVWRSLWRALGPQRRLDDSNRPVRGRQSLFRAARSAPLDPGVEGSHPRRRPQRPQGNDRVLWRERARRSRTSLRPR